MLREKAGCCASNAQIVDRGTCHPLRCTDKVSTPTILSRGVKVLIMRAAVEDSKYELSG